MEGQVLQRKVGVLKVNSRGFTWRDRKSQSVFPCNKVSCWQRDDVSAIARFGFHFSSKALVYGPCLSTLPLTSNETLAYGSHRCPS